MDSSETVRREILRLAGIKRQSVCINTRRISDFYNIPEKSVRRELTKLAEEKLIRLAGWDGRELRPFTAWRTADEFIESSLGAGHVHVDLWDNEQF
jgi:Mn-dependent DtxR family transcriptional regulator